ncbi:MAG: hypothetical protein OIF51_16320 [Cellvibrionaceae bacterium]|nr:hypothetical protein [Cellvibrionaceae bacterium]
MKNFIKSILIVSVPLLVYILGGICLKTISQWRAQPYMEIYEAQSKHEGFDWPLSEEVAMSRYGINLNEIRIELERREQYRNAATISFIVIMILIILGEAKWLSRKLNI